MNALLSFKLLLAQLHTGRDVDITVTGISMNPAFYEGDILTIRQSETYSIGDILVFFYKNELLVHRLLKKENNLFFCKGDNSFRLENVTWENIAGKVVFCNGHPVVPLSPTALTLSYLVNRTFRKCGYNHEITKQSGIYRFYHKTIWKTEDTTMKYQKNTKLDYIPTDKTSLAVFDPESGDTHFFDETGMDILACLETACDLETLLERLCKIYNATPDEIRNDVEEFLTETVAKKVVLVL